MKHFYSIFNVLYVNSNAKVKLKDALTRASALDAFENSAPSMKKEYVRQVEEAKAQETRERRIAKIVEKLSVG